MVRLRSKTAVVALAVALVAVVAFSGLLVWRVRQGESGGSVGTLAPAQFRGCAREGREVAQYLLTGRPESLDSDLASTRAQILQEPKASRDGLIRADADQVISSCDAGADKARAIASASASAARLAAEFAAACTADGGTVRSTLAAGVGCYVSFPGHPNGEVPLNPNGTRNQGEYSANQAACASDSQEAQQDGQAGNPWLDLPAFDSETGVCNAGVP